MADRLDIFKFPYFKEPSRNHLFGYDHPGGGYERDMGGRPHPNERPHGRFFGRSSGGGGGYQDPSDWDSGRAAHGDMSNQGNTREGLMSYKQFIQELEDDVLPSEAESRYQEYKTEYITTQKRVFFDTHKAEEWLKNKYHPTNLVAVIERRNELAQKVAKDFFLALQSGTLEIDPCASAPSKGDPKYEDDMENGKRRRHGRGPSKETDLLLSAPKAHPISSEPRRILIDIEQALALVRKLDFEKGIEENILSGSDTDKVSREKSSSGPVIIVRGLSSVKGLEGVELLDALLTYLWRIHGLDYYGVIETSEPKGFRHVRAEGKGSDINGGADWEKELDSRWQERLNSQDPLDIMTAKEKIESAAVEALDPYIRKIRDEKYGWKYGCGAKGCTKLFHAAEYVHKHLKLKHPEVIMDLTVKLREDIYHQNYMNDVNAPGGIPVMQQPLQKDKHQRSKPGIESRLKDDRGDRRERENRGANNGNGRFDRSENNQSNDFPSNNGRPDGGNHDEHMFNTFGGQGMHVGAFPPEIPPPPVLMPVPGAGPLGPFVPAPPEVALRMFREQAGPPSFDVRNVHPGPQIGGPPPILLPPNFRQDPRRLRSYQDLDAIEDEVTVIDYRSL
ncbi:hypothetical protein ACFE04_007627 [Oxalis oulophora]